MTAGDIDDGREPLSVALDDDAQLRYWVEKLGATEEQLRAAVAAVGPAPDWVRAYLQAS